MYRPLLGKLSVENLKCLSLLKRYSSNVRIEVAQGTVIGIEGVHDDNSKFYSFKGVPYAEPPIGNLRFQPPVPLKKFNPQILDCSKERSVCFHKDAASSKLVGSEDCLFLNIYTPTLPSSASTKPLPVLIWIHGGAFGVGSGSSDLYSPERIIQEDVIVVTLNYRLGALGFACLPEAGVSGNNGLRDQLQAMKWVQQNIRQFGGDPNNVTLFGESAGGSCIHLHLMSPISRQFFHKVICQSGTNNMEWVIAKEQVKKTKKLGQLMGCTSTRDKDIIEYLRDPASKLKDIIKETWGVLTPDDKRRGLPMPFKTVVESESPNAIVTKDPTEALKTPNSFDIPILMGYNSEEGMIFLLDAFKKLNTYEKDLARLIPKSLKIATDDPECLQVAERMRKFYFNGGKISTDNLPPFIDLLSDYNFNIAAVAASELHSRYQHASTQYFYRFSYDGDLNLFKKLFGLDKLKGACHGDEMYYLFNMNLMRTKLPTDSPALKVAKNMCRMWTNFAKYGNPTPDNSLHVKWNPVKTTSTSEEFVLDYLDIGEHCEMRQNPDHERMQFWKDLFKEYNGSYLNPWT